MKSIRSVVRPSPGWTFTRSYQSSVELQVPPMRALDTHVPNARGRQVIAPLAGGVGTRYQAVCRSALAMPGETDVGRESGIKDGKRRRQCHKGQDAVAFTHTLPRKGMSADKSSWITADCHAEERDGPERVTLLVVGSYMSMPSV